MSLDGELKKWRDATEQLEPSAQLMASLQAQVTPPPTSAPPVGGSLAAKVVVTVVLFTLAIGAAAYFFVAPKLPRVNASALDSGVRTPHDGGRSEALLDRDAVEPCPPRDEPALASPMMPSPARLPSQREVANDARTQLTRRPLTCAAQLSPIEDLRAHGHLADDERLTLDARRAVLCGLGSTDFSNVSPRQAMWDGKQAPSAARPCDESQWCHVPQCSFADERCLRELAALNSTACAVFEARRRLLDHECVRVLRRQTDGGTELARLNASFSSFSPDAGTAWCLERAAVDEAKRLFELEVPLGSPIRRK